MGEVTPTDSAATASAGAAAPEAAPAAPAASADVVGEELASVLENVQADFGKLKTALDDYVVALLNKNSFSCQFATNSADAAAQCKAYCNCSKPQADAYESSRSKRRHLKLRSWGCNSCHVCMLG